MDFVQAVASEAALELVKCCGQFDASAATQYLAVYQVFSFSVVIQYIVRQITKNWCLCLNVDVDGIKLKAKEVSS